MSSIFDLDDPGQHVEVCSGRDREDLIWTIWGGMWSLAPGDVVKVLSGRSGIACGGLLRTISRRVHVDDAG